MGFNGYSASGDATAEVVYAHHGLPADYQRLRSEGVSAEGKIVIARYGGSFRGVKAKVAEENQAAALIIYSDPEDDGYHGGDTYPDGPWRPASGVQRGSVLYIFHYPGDPTTPDGPSVAGAPRIAPADATNMTHLPVLPLSYADARIILENLSGPVAPREWQGGLPFTYHLGPGPAKVRLRVRMDHAIKPVWNVVAKIRGAERPDEVIVLGNHRDAWTYGGVDPNSGTTAMLEMARGLGALLRTGWRPRRSLWLCSWDAEEQGLIGSTEWTEKHAAELQQKAVAYLNLDSAVAGDRFGASAVPSLKEFLREVAADVADPKGGSVLERANQRLRERLQRGVVPGRAPSDGTEPKPIAERRIDIGNLGSGSDYTAFLDHLGIPATNFGFGGDYGVYHSIFDNHRWMKEFGDPEFLYHVAAARYYGLQALRLAQADLLPFDYQAYGQEIQKYVKGIRNKLVLLGQASELDFAPVEKAARRLADTPAKTCVRSTSGRWRRASSRPTSTASTAPWWRPSKPSCCRRGCRGGPGSGTPSSPPAPTPATPRCLCRVCMKVLTPATSTKPAVNWKPWPQPSTALLNCLSLLGGKSSEKTHTRSHGGRDRALPAVLGGAAGISESHRGSRGGQARLCDSGQRQRTGHVPKPRQSGKRPAGAGQDVVQVVHRPLH